MLDMRIDEGAEIRLGIEAIAPLAGEFARLNFPEAA
jgi:hypothetical protein